MTIKIAEGCRKRQNALRKLAVFLQNPGRFCVFVAGNSGTGKRFAIEHLYEKLRKSDQSLSCFESIHFEDARHFLKDGDDPDKLLKKCNNGLLVVEDVEHLSPSQQELLFQALSTSDGKFGHEKKEFELRMVFTSSADLNLLREADYYLKGRFWDRISQLIVKLPSYSDEDGEIVDDFEVTWHKMRFDTIKGCKGLAGCPKNANWEKFLQKNATQFTGGFRDLDKLACMYFNYRLLHYGEKRKVLEETEKLVVQSISDDFFTQSHLNENVGNTLSEFVIQAGLSWKEMEGNFKDQIRRWGKNQYGTIKATEQKLGLRPGTMKNWKKEM